MEGGCISLKKVEKYSRSGNKRKTRQIVKEEVDKVERSRKPRNGSRKKVTSTGPVNKTEEVIQDIRSKFKLKSNIVIRFKNGYLCWDCAIEGNIRITKSDEATLFRSNDMANDFCKENNINQYTLEEL